MMSYFFLNFSLLFLIDQKHIGGSDDLQALHRKEGLPRVIAGTA